MNLFRKHPLSINEWTQNIQDYKAEHFVSEGLEYWIGFQILKGDINPTFIVSIQLSIEAKEDKIFYAKTTSDFLVSKETDKDTLPFLFSLVKQAYSDFSNHFYRHTHKTELSRFLLIEPVQETFQKVLSQNVSRYSDGTNQIASPTL